MRGLLLAVIALLIVAGDSGRFVPQLIHNASVVLNQKNTGRLHMNAAVSMLWHAAIQGNEQGQSLILSLFQEAYNTRFETEGVDQIDASYWLVKLVKLENAEAAWLLYQIMGQQGDSERFMRLAAMGDVAEAQLAFAMSSDSPEEREKWLVRAASQGYVPAQAALADWYLLHGKQQQAKPLLAATAELDMQSAFKYGRLLWNEEYVDEAKIHFARAAKLGHQQALSALSVIKRYQQYSPSNIPPINWASVSRDGSECLQRIQPFATGLASIIRADSLYYDFVNDERLSTLPLCIAPPIWLKNDTLSCSANFKNKGVLGCDVSPLAVAAKQRAFSHTVVVSEQGKANVQNGVMYLDISDAYSVFVHELAHFSGFVDEYPIGRAMARKVCDEDNINDFLPPNVVVDSEYWYSPHSTVDNWLRIDPDTPIAPAKTCMALGKNSYKPSQQITFMEHHDSGVIPPLYLVLWREQLTKQNVQRPISMNFFQIFHQRGNHQEAAHWLGEYEAFISE